MEIRSLSPRDLAAVLGVSESSVKRWVDAGRIPVSRTAGGHRRIMLPDALRFIREQGMRLVRPDLLGMDDIASLESGKTQALTGEMLSQAVESGDAARARGLVLQAYLSGTAPSALFDGPVAQAMERYGTLHRHDPMGIPHEHRFTQVCLEAIHQLRMLQPAPLDDAPLALGGAPAGDPYLLPSLMASVVFAQAGFREMNLGPDLPAGALDEAVGRFDPDVIWLSVTSPLEREAFDGFGRVLDAMVSGGRSVFVGGREAHAWRDQWPSGVALNSTMTDLAAAARSLR